MTAHAERPGGRATLRWTLCVTAVVIIVGSAALFLALLRDGVERFVRQDEISGLRGGALVELRTRCKDYVLNPDREAIEKYLVSLTEQHESIAYVGFVDPHLEGDGLVSSMTEPASGLLDAARDAAAVPEGRTRRVGGELVIDFTETIQADPAYTVHVGLRQAVIRERTRSLFVRMTIIAALIAAAGAALACGVILLIVGPVDKLVADATRLSLGDMRVTFTPRGRGELGRLADTLDRLKESVLCALRRSGVKSAGPKPEDKK
ncbi:MAG: HAMP domain-containing protein [Verrucomicrobia bacterium]|nr:HAMP domain-containing protein [Verrucomicrobiota bacterium]